jgi:hypothetical protein
MVKFPTWLYDGILSDREPRQVELRHQTSDTKSFLECRCHHKPDGIISYLVVLHSILGNREHG